MAIRFPKEDYSNVDSNQFGSFLKIKTEPSEFNSEAYSEGTSEDSSIGVGQVGVDSVKIEGSELNLEDYDKECAFYIENNKCFIQQDENKTMENQNSFLKIWTDNEIKVENDKDEFVQSGNVIGDYMETSVCKIEEEGLDYKHTHFYSVATEISLPAKQEDNIHLKQEVKKHKCQYCVYSAPQKVTLDRHVNAVHLKLRNHVCPFCDYSAAVRGTLKTHVNAIHLQLIKHKCERCDFSTFSKNSLMKHVDAIHLKLKKHGCHLCDYTVANKCSLKRHMNKKHSTKRIKCDSCDYSVADKNDLTKHVNAVHLKLRNFVCGMCDYSSCKKYNLKSHVDAVHLKLKNYKCHLCNFSAGFSSGLKTHVDEVHFRLKNRKCLSTDIAANKRRIE